MRYFSITLCLAVLLVSCDQRKGPKDRVIGKAFVGPVTLNLRREISPASQTAARASHGEKVEVIQVRRRFVRVRTPRGEEGWTDSRDLLTAEQMEAIGELAKRAARMPSQGQATVYSSLNMHTDPTRNSTSFFQITESMTVDVLAHQLSPKAAGPPPAGFQVRRPPPPAPRRKPKKESVLTPPPTPPPPGLPINWVELSKSTPAPEDSPSPSPPPPKLQMDDWYLVRTKEGKAGWVVARMVNLAIPDEVAQYSEGARITSYFALKDVRDGDAQKHHWLWTTIREGQQPYQFDSFRVFTYVVRRHRYETSYIERDVEGYYPVEATPGPVPRFSLILRGSDGRLYRKTYVMEGYLVRKVGEVPYSKPNDPGPEEISNLPEAEDKDEPESPSLGERIKNLFKRTAAQ